MTTVLIEDLYLAAVLILHGAKLIDIKTDKNTKHGTFVLENVDKNIIGDYYLKQTLVEPVDFYYNIKSLTTAVRKRLENG